MNVNWNKLCGFYVNSRFVTGHISCKFLESYGAQREMTCDDCFVLAFYTVIIVRFWKVGGGKNIVISLLFGMMGIEHSPMPNGILPRMARIKAY